MAYLEGQCYKSVDITWCHNLQNQKSASKVEIKETEAEKKTRYNKKHKIFS